MKGNTNYFSHDYNSQSDPKIIEARMKYGWGAYGIFWAIVERLYQCGGYLDKKYTILSYDLQADEKQIKYLVEETGLFIVDEEKFTAKRVLEHFDFRKKQSDFGRRGAEKKHSHPIATLKPPYSHPVAIKERKGKEMKGNKRSSTLNACTSDEFILSLKTNPAYIHINIEKELAKMDAWLSARKGRQKTRRFIVNWLNRIEQPIAPQQKKAKSDERVFE